MSNEGAPAARNSKLADSLLVVGTGAIALALAIQFLPAAAVVAVGLVVLGSAGCPAIDLNKKTEDEQPCADGGWKVSTPAGPECSGNLPLPGNGLINFPCGAARENSCSGRIVAIYPIKQQNIPVLQDELEGGLEQKAFTLGGNDGGLITWGCNDTVADPENNYYFGLISDNRVITYQRPEGDGGFTTQSINLEVCADGVIPLSLNSNGSLMRPSADPENRRPATLTSFHLFPGTTIPDGGALTPNFNLGDMSPVCDPLSSEHGQAGLPFIYPVPAEAFNGNHLCFSTKAVATFPVEGIIDKFSYRPVMMVLEETK
ncbi:MAG: hypothetical protein ABIH50_04870 [bacterium]